MRRAPKIRALAFLSTFLSMFLMAAALPLAAQKTAGCKEADSSLAAAARALPGPDAPGRQAFDAFQQAAAKAAGAAGARELGARIARLRAAAPVSAADAGLASCLLRRYTLARYGERMVADLRELVAFQTFVVEGRENWNAPEFVRQREWLEKRARERGFCVQEL